MGRDRRRLLLDLDRLRGPGLPEPAARAAAAGRRQGREGQGVIRPRQGGPSDKTLPTPDPSQVQLIRSYGPGHFLIGEREWRSPVLVTPTRTTAWNVTRAEDLALDNLSALEEAPPPTELLVVGCGPRAVFLPPALRASLKSAGLSLEVVDTGSACRIYNVLLAERRRVAAALIPV
ncbi:MAG: hypothetical protein GEV13_32020 [Rhodospirillales bacterium]|nr:hypothetical protein [Rhodospirillales bacterium]